MNWQPTAPLTNIKARAQILKKIRAFFNAKNILEIETPLLCTHTVTDPHIDSIKTATGFMQTSPEYAMKRFIAAYKCDCWQICKAFRNAETGKLHNPEFTILEWYRIGMNHRQLMQEVDELMQTILNTAPSTHLSYQAVFEKYLQLNPLTITTSALKAIADQFNCPNYLEKTDLLDFLFATQIQKNLQQPTFIHSFPIEMAALAKINADTAERFEWFYQGIELANGFHELNNKLEQEQRFQENLITRSAQNKTTPTIDDKFLACLDHLPDCAGVAVGVDRLMLLALGENDITSVLCFTNNNSSKPIE